MANEEQTTNNKQQGQEAKAACPLICHMTSVHDGFDTRILWKECVSVARSKYRLVLIASAQEDNQCEEVTFDVFPRFRPPLLRIAVAPWVMLYRALKAKADLYHFHDPELVPVGLLLRLLTRKPVVYDVHEDVSASIRVREYIPKWLREPLAWGYRMLENVACRCMTVVIAEKYYADFLPKGVPVLNYPILGTADGRRETQMWEEEEREDRRSLGVDPPSSNDAGTRRESLSVISHQGKTSDIRHPISDLHPLPPALRAPSSEFETAGACRLKPVHQPTTNNQQPITDNRKRINDACAHWLFYSGSVTRVRGALYHARMANLVDDVGVYSAGRCSPTELAEEMRGQSSGFRVQSSGLGEEEDRGRRSEVRGQRSGLEEEGAWGMGHGARMEKEEVSENRRSLVVGREALVVEREGSEAKANVQRPINNGRRTTDNGQRTTTMPPEDGEECRLKPVHQQAAPATNNEQRTTNNQPTCAQGYGGQATNNGQPSLRLVIEGEGFSVNRQRLDDLAMNYHWLAGLAVFPKTEHYRRKELTKFFEYMQAGIPILCSNMEAWKEFVEGQGIGVTVDPEDLDDQREKIQYLIDHPDECREMGRRGRRLVETHYNWQTQADRLLRLYDDLLDPRKGAKR
ncbi:MAG: glycosyltransferase [Lentisphaeria bacterium]|nr:glycosyltransferase [Lentisphaeria bacterium]